MKTARTAVFTNGLIAVAAFFVTSMPFAAQAALQVSYEGPDQEKNCHVMLAGQHIEAGQVCLEVEGENLLVTYEMQDGWELTEAHLWAGLTLASMPQSKTGNPKIGNFPYNSGSITGADSHTFTVPLTVFGSVEPCDVTGLLAAHAAVRKANGDGTYQTETGWLEGAQISAKGSWAMNSSIFFTCPADVVPPPVVECSNETAYAVGEKTFLKDRDDLSIGTKWGWQITVPAGDRTIEKDIYAGAAQNDTSKGTLIGTLTVERAGTTLNVSYNTPGATMYGTHLYVGDTYVPVTSPGQYSAYGYQVESHAELGGTHSDSYEVQVGETGTLYVVAHAATEVCK